MTAPAIERQMSERLQRILDFIWAYWRQAGSSPSVREIAEGAGISSTSVVAYHLKGLRRRGLIHLPAARLSRGIVPTGAACPCCGRKWEAND